ncbi:hypothetical protein EMO56_14715 [Escherichia coli]|nr:hypothetical protein [Escherichia coli]
MITQLTDVQLKKLRRLITSAKQDLEKIDRLKAEHHEFIYKVALDTGLEPEKVATILRKIHIKQIDMNF